MTSPQAPAGATPAAQYLRMSTDNQRYSLENQAAAIATYAAANGYEVVRTYVDAGKSGLTATKRGGLQTLLRDVLGGKAAFSVVLVLDVSRWGRFQDPDEAAHYEFLCKEVGVQVRYCAEPFGNDAMGSIMKQLKRVMAGEYSRELSQKVRAAHLRHARAGFIQGGKGAYGVRRQVVDGRNNRTRVLEVGERKSLRDDRIVWIWGPSTETDRVRWIFRRYVEDREGLKTIARELNDQGISAVHGGPWSSCSVRTVLSNEIYLGNYVYNVGSASLGQPRRLNARDQWVRVKVLDAIISKRLFDGAARRMRDMHRRRLDSEDMIQRLRAALELHGELSSHILNEDPATPSAATYINRFGSLTVAYDRIGYRHRRTCFLGSKRPTDEMALEHLRRIHGEAGYIKTSLIAGDDRSPSVAFYFKRFGSLLTAYQLAGLPSDLSEIHRAGARRSPAFAGTNMKRDG